MMYDVVVVGSGASGMTAALVSAQLGLKVLLVEKTDLFGGTSAYSGGAMWIPNSLHQKIAGIEDSVNAADNYLRGVTGKYYDHEKVSAFLVNAPKMIRFVEQHSELRCFSAAESFDYEPWHEGACGGRTLFVAPFDNRKLGMYRNRLRSQLPQMTLFNGMQIDLGDVGHFMEITRSFKSFSYSAKLFCRYLLDRILHNKTTRSCNGTALTGVLLRALLDLGVTLWNSTSVTRLNKGK
ncbi:MAG: FAD-dependent oxidoreductase [Porticoccaceae bacterium]